MSVNTDTPIIQAALVDCEGNSIIVELDINDDAEALCISAAVGLMALALIMDNSMQAGRVSGSLDALRTILAVARDEGEPILRQLERQLSRVNGGAS